MVRFCDGIEMASLMPPSDGPEQRGKESRVSDEQHKLSIQLDRK